MNLVLAVLAIPVSVYYGLIPWFQLKETVKVLVIVYVGLLAVTALYNLIRSPLRLLARNHQEIGQITAKLQDIDSRLTEISSIRLLPETVAPTPPPKPVAVPQTSYINRLTRLTYTEHTQGIEVIHASPKLRFAP